MRPLSRFARLTLYSGPQCSLCDVRSTTHFGASLQTLTQWCLGVFLFDVQVAKAELAKVRKTVR